jgi:hypothetical protein
MFFINLMLRDFAGDQTFDNPISSIFSAWAAKEASEWQSFQVCKKTKHSRGGTALL